jgi:hypothetical protein
MINHCLGYTPVLGKPSSCRRTTKRAGLRTCVPWSLRQSCSAALDFWRLKPKLDLFQSISASLGRRTTYNNIIFIGTPWKTVAFFWQLGSGRVWPRRCKTLWELQIRASASVVTNSVREVGQSPYILWRCEVDSCWWWLNILKLMIQIPKIYETLAKSGSEFRASFLFISSSENPEWNRGPNV